MEKDSEDSKSYAQLFAKVRLNCFPNLKLKRNMTVGTFFIILRMIKSSQFVTIITFEFKLDFFFQERISFERVKGT